MSEFLIVSSTFARAPLLAIVLVFGLLVAFGAIVSAAQQHRLRRAARADRQGTRFLRANVCPLALVFVAGVYMPPALVAWFQNVAGLLGIDDAADRRPPRRAAGRRASTMAARRGDGGHLANVADELAGGRATLLGLWGDAQPPSTWRSWASKPPRLLLLRLVVRTAAFLRSAPCIRPPSVSNARFSVYTGSNRSACRIRGPGSISAFGMCGIRLVPKPQLAQHGRLHISAGGRREPASDSRLAPCMPASSSQAISASPPTARPWCGSNSGSATSTRGSSGLMAGATIERCGATGRAYLRRQHRRLQYRFRARGRGGAQGCTAPPRAQYLRALMAELERLANHLGDIGAICNDASFALMHAHCGILRERVLAGCGCRVRSSADDGSRRTWRRRRRS